MQPTAQAVDGEREKKSPEGAKETSVPLNGWPLTNHEGPTTIRQRPKTNGQ